MRHVRLRNGHEMTNVVNQVSFVVPGNAGARLFKKPIALRYLAVRRCWPHWSHTNRAIGHRQQHSKMHLPQLSQPCLQATRKPSLSLRFTDALNSRPVCACLRQTQLPAGHTQSGHLHCLAPAAAANSTLQLDAQQATAAAEQSRRDSGSSSVLENFMVWLVNNGEH